MGNIATTLFCTSVSAPDQKTRQYLEKICEKAVKVGGNNDFTKGGYDSLADYGNSMFSQAKEKLIRGIAKDVAGVLKISPSFAEKANLKDVIEKFTKVVPDPRKGRKIKSDSKIHNDVCKQLANAINKNYKLDLVNKDDSAEQICKVVSELLYSLFTGFHSEFFTIASDVSRIVKNLTVMQEYLDGINKKLIKDLGDCSEGDAMPFKEAYEALTREINRQHAYLTNLVSGVIGPAGESLIHLVEENMEFAGLTDDLRDAAGTREFSDKLSTMMSGISSVTHAAFLVDKALKTIGMSVGEYKNTKNMKDLRAKIYDHMVKKKPNSKDLNKYMVAADILYRNDLAHDDIAAHLSKKGGEFISIQGGFDDSDSDSDSDSDMGIVGGDEGLGFAQMVSDGMYRDLDSVFQGRRQSQKKSITTQLKSRERFREKLFQDLNHQIKNSYNNIILDLHKIGKKIGSEIPATDKLRTFIRQLSYFADAQPDRKNLHKALSGWRQDVKSEYVKHDFIRSLETVASASSDLASGTSGSYFKNVSESINKLIKVITDFNNTFTKTLTEIHVDAPESKKGGSIITDLSSIEATVGGMKESEFKYLVTMQKAIREIEYYFKISNIKANLKVSAVQSESYTKNYENILGEECGRLIDDINQNAKKLTCNTEGISATKCKPYTIIDETNIDDKNKWRGFVFLIEYIRSAKVEMIEAAQALDLYLSKFTESIQSNPNDIKEFVKMLEQIEIVSKWFTDKSGDNLVNVFEAFKWGADARAPLPLNNTDDGKNIQITDHYYANINTDVPAESLMNMNIICEKQVKTFIIRIEKTFKSMRALENIISTFSKLSNKSSGDDIKTFMSPGMIFKSFMKYAVASSISVGGGAIDIKNTTVVSKADELDNYEKFIDKNTTKIFNFGLRNIRQIPNELNTNEIKSYIVSYDPLESAAMDTNGTITTDEIFEMSIKSLIAKVFVVVGAYSLFQRPAKDFNGNLALSNQALRQIMGGGSSSVKIIPEAVELYIRLPLLAEWYREIFKFNKNEDKADIIISMIPNFDGIWANFVKVIFVDGDGINDGGYTTSFNEQIISSINDIYTHYKPKYGANMCIKVLENFVSEVNLRYGLIKKNEITNYINERNAGLTNDDEYDNDENVDYDILDSNDQFGRKPAPSDKFRKVGVNNYLGKGTTTESKAFKDAIEKFRIEVENGLTLDKFNDKDTNFGTLSLQYTSVDDLVKQTINRIHESKSDDEKYNIVQTVIIGAERFSEFDYDEMMLFHETVINPLTILFIIYNILNDYNRFANSLDVGDNASILTKKAETVVPGSITPTDQVSYVDFINHLKNKKKGADKYFTDTKCYFEKSEYNMYINDSDTNEIIKNSKTTTWGDINYTDAKDNTNTALFKKYEELYTRYCMRKKNLMRDCINHMYYLTCDKNPLVELIYSGDGENRFPMLKFNKMEKVAMELYECIKESLTKFRKILPHKEIVKYESLKDELGNDNINSLFYIKEHLFDRLFANKYGGGLSDANTAFKNIWLYLTKKWSFNNFTTNKIAKTSITDFNDKIDDEKYDSYDSVISKLTYWYSTDEKNTMKLDIKKVDFNKFPFNFVSLVNEPNLGGKSGLTDKIRNKLDQLHMEERVTWYDSGEQIGSLTKNISTKKGSAQSMAYQILYPTATTSLLKYTKFSPFVDGTTSQFKFLENLFSEPTLIYDLPLIINAIEQDSKEQPKDVLTRYKNIYTMYNRIISIKSIKTPVADDIVDPQIVELGINYTFMKSKKMKVDLLDPKELELISPLVRFTTPSDVNGMNVGSNMLYEYDSTPTINSTEYKNDAIELSVYDTGIAGSYGLISKLNNLIYKCIEMFTDTSSKKIYLPLFEQFANGLNAGEIMNGKAIDDITLSQANGLVFQNLEIEKNQAIFATVAQAIKSIVTSKIMTTMPLSVLKHAEKDLTNISEYMKDLMTAYLPIFEKELHILSCKADLIKGILENTKIRVYSTDRPIITIGTCVLKTNGTTTEAEELEKVNLNKIALPLKAVTAVTNNARKGFLISLLSHISASSKSFESCVRNVYKELNDIPLYFETYKNSIADYQNRNNIMPLMPLSHVSYLLNTTLFTTAADGKTYTTARGGLIPHIKTGTGSSEFKFAYGTRGLLGYNEPSIDLAPGVTSILNIYNSKVGGAASYDKRKMSDIFKHCTLLLRYATDYIYHKTAIGDNNIKKCADFTRLLKIHNGLADVNIIGNLACQTGMHVIQKSKAIDYSIGNDEFFKIQSNIMLLIDNDNYKQSVYRLLTCITKSSHDNAKITGMARKDLRIYNILDCNIVPINFHALQSEIPLVNLMNYSYTFDQMVKQFIGISCKDHKISDIIIPFIDSKDVRFTATDRLSKKAKANSITKKYTNPEDTLVQMLISPRGSRNIGLFNTMIWRIMAGNTSLSLNKPKYLSDQLWNKSLLQSLYLPESFKKDTWTSPVTKDFQKPESRLMGNNLNRNYTMPDDMEEIGYIEFMKKPIYTSITGENGSGNQATHTYMDKSKQVKDAYAANDTTVSTWNKEGFIRYQKIIVRYIEWFIHLQRVMRLLMRDQLQWVDDPIVHRSDALAEEITEFNGNNVFDFKDFE
jgi:hypothetical protein